MKNGDCSGCKYFKEALKTKPPEFCNFRNKPLKEFTESENSQCVWGCPYYQEKGLSGKMALMRWKSNGGRFGKASLK